MMGCAEQKSEPKTVTIKYGTPRAAKTSVSYPAPTKEIVRVKQDTLVWDTAELVNGSAYVTVPLDTSIYIDYESYIDPHPELYGDGFSTNFVVTSSSPNTITVSIPVHFNTNHPIFETTQDNTTDNTTTEEITLTGDNVTWSDDFIRNTRPTQAIVTKYKNFWDNISVSDNWSKVSLGNPDNLTSCDNASQVIAGYKAENDAVFSCNGKTWRIGQCGGGRSIAVGSTGDCSCTTKAWTVRPLIGNSNWGGVGNECRAHSQTLTIIFER